VINTQNYKYVYHLYHNILLANSIYLSQTTDVRLERYREKGELIINHKAKKVYVSTQWNIIWVTIICDNYKEAGSNYDLYTIQQAIQQDFTALHKRYAISLQPKIFEQHCLTVP